MKQEKFYGERGDIVAKVWVEEFPTKRVCVSISHAYQTFGNIEAFNSFMNLMKQVDECANRFQSEIDKPISEIIVE